MAADVRGFRCAVSVLCCFVFLLDVFEVFYALFLCVLAVVGVYLCCVMYSGTFEPIRIFKPLSSQGLVVGSRHVGGPEKPSEKG